MKRVVRLGMTVAVAMGVLGATAPPAAAGGFPFTVTCAQTPSLNGIWTSNGNGPWVPALDTNSTLVFHPTAFPTFTGTFTPADGSPSITVNDDPSARTKLPRNGQPIIRCAYHFVETDPSGTFVGNGTVDGWTSGTHHS